MTSGRAGARRWVAAVVVTAGVAWSGAAGAAVGAEATLDATCQGDAWTATLAVTNADTRSTAVAGLTATGVASTAFAPLTGGTVLAPGATVSAAAGGLARTLAGVSVTITLSAGDETTTLVRSATRPAACAPAATPTPAPTTATDPAQPVVAGTVPVTASREASGVTVADTAVTVDTTTATTTAPASSAAPTASTAAAPVASTAGPATVTTAARPAAAAPTTVAATRTTAAGAAAVAPTTGATIASPVAAPPTAASTAPARTSDGSSTGMWIGAALVLAAIVGALLLLLAWRRRRPQAWVTPSVPLPPILLDPPPALSGSGVFVAAADTDRDALDAVVAELRANGYLVSHERALAEAGATSVRVAAAHAVEHALAVVLLVSPAAQRSPEVARQIALADDAGRAVVPLLIEGDGDVDGPLRLFLADTDLIDGRGAAHRRGMNIVLQVLQAKVARRLASPPPPGAGPHRAPTALASQ